MMAEETPTPYRLGATAAAVSSAFVAWPARIPARYRLPSTPVAERRAVLQGVVDVAGECGGSGSGQLVVATRSLGLAGDIVRLVEDLGGAACLVAGDGDGVRHRVEVALLGLSVGPDIPGPPKGPVRSGAGNRAKRSKRARRARSSSALRWLPSEDSLVTVDDREWMYRAVQRREGTG